MITRRRMLVLCAGGIASVAGCSSNQGDGSDGGGNDGSDGDPTSTATETPADDGDSQGNGNGDASQLGETVAFPDSYAMTVTMSTGGQTVDMSGRFYQGDMYWQVEQQGQQMEWYLIGENSYVVTQGQCFSGSMMQGGMRRENVDPGMFSAGAEANPSVTPKGRDTIDGAEVLVYEVSGSAIGGVSETVTYYVLADSGYLRRIASESMQWDFHSWGDVDPIQKPSGNCQSMPGGRPTATSDSGG